MTNQLTQLDLDILKSYADKGDRPRYWSYLAVKGDPYAALALGVVLNNTPPGQVANNFFWTSYRPNSQAVVNEAELNEIGKRLMEQDFKQRLGLFNQNRPEEALRLPALNIYAEHMLGLPSIDYWTPEIRNFRVRSRINAFAQDSISFPSIKDKWGLPSRPQGQRRNQSRHGCVIRGETSGLDTIFE